jgi:hypothetical protein
MAISYVGSGGYNYGVQSGGNWSFALSFPSGILNADICIASVMVQDNSSGTGSVNTPTGWTLVGHNGQQHVGGWYLDMYVCVAQYNTNLTGTFTGTATGSGLGGDGVIVAIRGANIKTGNSSFPAGNSITTTTPITAPSGFTANQWNYWAAGNLNNKTVSSTSPTLNNTYFNTGHFQAYEIGFTQPSSAPGTETITWSASCSGCGAGVTFFQTEIYSLMPRYKVIRR